MEEFLLLVFNKKVDPSEGLMGDFAMGGWGAAGEEEMGYYDPTMASLQNSMSSYQAAGAAYAINSRPPGYPSWAASAHRSTTPSAGYSQAAYSGYSYQQYQQHLQQQQQQQQQLQQQTNYHAYEKFPSYARSEVYASSLPGGPLPYPLRPPEALAAGYGKMPAHASSRGQHSATTAYQHGHSRGGAALSHYSSSVPAQSHPSHWTAEPLPSSGASSFDNNYMSRMTKESRLSSSAEQVPQQPESTDSLPTDEATSASTAQGRSPEIQSFLESVRQSLGEEMFAVFLGELTSLKSFVQNKKALFAQKV